ncbi:MAG TPA: protein kinase [Acidimicrobiales bacterium]|nr:protein kinase [Acidimicrobiales bacterium]
MTVPDQMVASRYRLGELLGRGGMAEVRAARDERLDRDVAVKILRPELAADPLIRQRFESEARTSARLSHPNVVNVFDAGSDDELVYMVMERLPGETLDDELAAGPMAVDRVVSVGAQVLDALAAAHAAGVIHRDIKPGNVLTCPDGVVKVADFGIATVLGAASVTATGLIIGTPTYLAPERADGQMASDRSDVYSVGAVLYTCLTGRRPFEADSAVALMAVMQTRDPTPIGELRPEVPAALAAVVARAMAKDPARRFGSAAEMRVALLATGPDALGMGTTGGMSPLDATSVMAPAGLAGAAGIGAAGATGATGVVMAGPPRLLVREGRGWRRASILLVGAAIVIVLAAVGSGLVHGGGATKPGGTTTTTTNRKAASTSTTASTSTSTSTTSGPSTTTSTTTTSSSTSVTVTIPTSTSSPSTTQAPATTTTASNNSSG